MKQFVLGVALVCGVTLAPAHVSAQETQQSPTKTQPSTQATQPSPKEVRGTTGRAAATSLAVTDRRFMRKAAIGGLAKVEYGRVASEKASNADVKSFGQRMVTDHGKANDELKQLAQQKNYTLPTDLDARHRRVRDRLLKLSGASLDRAYMKEMVSDHEEDVAEFRKVSESANDPDVKAWAGKTLPTLEEHLKLARETQAKVGGAEESAAKTPATAKKPGKKPVTP